jgi:hypothetical protein
MLSEVELEILAGNRIEQVEILSLGLFKIISWTKNLGVPFLF